MRNILEHILSQLLIEMGIDSAKYSSRLHFERTKFASKSCDDGVIEIYLKGKPDPYLSICGENVSLIKELPILSAAELTPKGHDPSITIQFIGRASPTRAAFKIAWTELFHLPRNQDGSLTSSRLIEGGDPNSLEGCEFSCPGDQGLCIPTRLVCNGVVNCPNVTGFKETDLSDEAEQLCKKETVQEVNKSLLFGIAGLLILLTCTCCIWLCRRCYKCCCSEDDDD